MRQKTDETEGSTIGRPFEPEIYNAFDLSVIRDIRSSQQVHHKFYLCVRVAQVADILIYGSH